MAGIKTGWLLMALLLAFSSLSFAEEAENKSADWIQGYARRGAKENPLPPELAKKIEEDYFKATTDPKLETKKPLVRQMMTVSTEMTQEKLRALKGPTRILTPPGGGTIDLADYVTPLKGEFNMKIVVEDEHREPQAVSKVYFISGSKTREIDHEKYGAGCGKYMDVTSYFKKRMSAKGFELYTAEQRYVAVLRGTFVFVSYLPEALRIASVTFLDSRFNHWDCPQTEVL